jgi:hypothetical protein
LKLGIPTMMSARSRRAISLRMAGVSTVSGTTSPYHRGASEGAELARRDVRGERPSPVLDLSARSSAVRDLSAAG